MVQFFIFFLHDEITTKHPPMDHPIASISSLCTWQTMSLQCDPKFGDNITKREHLIVEHFVKSWHQSPAELAKTWMWELLHKGVTQAFSRLELLCSKSCVRLSNISNYNKWNADLANLMSIDPRYRPARSMDKPYFIILNFSKTW